jgi:hypothetical protein
MAKTKTAEGAAEGAEAKTEAPARRLWVGPNGVREGTTYNEIQKIVRDNPGLTEEELKVLIPQHWQAPNSDKFKKNPGVFLQGYFTAGLRKGHFVDNEASANDSVPVVAASSGSGSKATKLTRAGRDLLSTIESADDFRDGDGYVARSKIDELLGRPMAQLGKGVQKLVADGLIEQSTSGDGEEAVPTVRITDAGRAILAEPEAPAAGEADAPAADATEEAQEA